MRARPLQLPSHLLRINCVTAEEEIASLEYIEAFRRLGAEVRVIDAMPRTPYTAGIPGGSQSFWGYALNKVVIVNYTEFASVVYIDADSLVLRNIDHLASEPGFTSSYTLTCCNPGLPACVKWSSVPHCELVGT